MCEPVMRRTAWSLSTIPSLHLKSPLLKALSLCSLFSLSLLSVPAIAEPTDGDVPYAVESPKAASSLLLDVVNTGKRLVAAGDRGHILVSADQGHTWTQSKVPTRQLLTAIYFVDEQRGWAVGHDAQILATTDGGLTWTQQYEDLELEAPLLDIWFKDAQVGFAVGAYGVLLATEDGGQTWDDVSDRLDNEDAYHLNAITAVKGGGLFLVGEMGMMFRSRDDGQTWEAVPERPYEGTFFGVLGTDQADTVLAYGLRGHLFRSTDLGNTWRQIKVRVNGNGEGSLEFSLVNGTLLDDGSVVIVGNGGTVLRSEDGGVTFALYNRPDRLSLAAVAPAAAGQLLLVGQSGARLVSTTGADLAEQ